MAFTGGPLLIAEPWCLTLKGEWQAWQETLPGDISRVHSMAPMLATASEALQHWNTPDNVQFRAIVFECMRAFSFDNYEEAILATDGTHWPIWEIGMDTWLGKRMASTIFALRQVRKMLTAGKLVQPLEEDEVAAEVLTLEQGVRDDYASLLGEDYRDSRNLPTLLNGIIEVCEASMLPCSVKYMHLLLGQVRQHSKWGKSTLEDHAYVPAGTFAKLFHPLNLERWDRGEEGFDLADRFIYGVVERTLEGAGKHLVECHRVVSEMADDDYPFCSAVVVREALAEVLSPKFR